jgi:hypothetical protein
VTWFYFIPSLSSLLFYVGALVFLFSRRDRHRQAAGMAMLGVSIMLVFHVAGSVTPIVMSYLFDTDSWVLYYGMIQAVMTFAHLGGFALVLAAVTVGRQPSDVEQQSYSTQGYINTDDNPYVPPLSR